MYAIMRFGHLYIRVPTYMYTCKYTDRAGPYRVRRNAFVHVFANTRAGP